MTACNWQMQCIYHELDLAKGKAGRRGMFTKYTWFGIPLN